MPAVDLNADLGEEAGGGSVDEPVLDVVTSASIACGFHAGDPALMSRTLEAARRRGVTVGAHPSYADREGFGRVDREVEPHRLTDDVLYQIGGLDALARACGAQVRYVKPHGALYNRMAKDESYAAAVCEAIRAFGGLMLLAPAGSSALEVAKGLGIKAVGEVFADRAYLSDARLAPRSSPGAVLTDPSEVALRAVSLATGRGVRSVDGTQLDLAGSSICLHGDTPGAVEVARRVRSALEDAGVTLSAFAS
ncbi:MAG: LamB/YcsF family protein [Acidimicrobiales bacterium]